MFLGISFLAFNATLANFLATIIPPAAKDPAGIFERPFEQYYDYIVVGSGSAGGIVATRLSEDRNSVLLLEAGGSDYDNEFTRIPLTFANVYSSDKVWGHYTTAQKNAFFGLNGQRGAWLSGKMLGGTSSLNAMIYVRGSRHDFDRWAREGCTGWSYKEVLPYFKLSENMTIPHLRNSVYHGRKGPITLTDSFSPIDLFHQKAAEELGFSNVDCNGADPQSGFCNVQLNIKDGERCGTSTCFLRPVLQRPNLQVNIRSYVTKVIINNGQAIGVEVIRDNKRYTIYTRKEIILSAGVVGTPHILLLSGIGPLAELQHFHIPVYADLPVGENFKDHSSVILDYSMNATLGLSTQRLTDFNNIMEYILYKKECGIVIRIALTTDSENREGHYYCELNKCDSDKSIIGVIKSIQDNISIYSKTTNGGRLFAHIEGTSPEPDINIEFVKTSVGPAQIMNPTANLRPEVAQKRIRDVTPNGFFLVLSNLQPKSYGTVSLTSSNPYHTPSIDPRYLSHPDDVETLLKVIRLARGFENTAAWKTLGAKLKRVDQPGFCNDILFDTDNYWRCIIRTFTRPGYHGIGTCRMGPIHDPRTVVDPQLRVKGIGNLRVADASVMPEIISGNTNAATMMIAEKAADLIKGRTLIDTGDNVAMPLTQNPVPRGPRAG